MNVCTYEYVYKIQIQIIVIIMIMALVNIVFNYCNSLPALLHEIK